MNATRNQNKTPKRAPAAAAKRTAKRAPSRSRDILAGEITAAKYTTWEHSDIKIFLHDGAMRVTEIASGFENWYSQQNSAHLIEGAAVKTKRARAALHDRNRALERAREIYGVIIRRTQRDGAPIVKRNGHAGRA